MITKTQQDYIDTIRTHVEASNPCTWSSVVRWCAHQGYGGTRMIKALQELKESGIISTENEDGSTVIILN